MSSNSRTSRHVLPLAQSENGAKFPKDHLLIEKLVTVEELAEALGLAPQTIRNWVALRQIPFVRIGGRTRFLKRSIEAWLEQKEFNPCR